MIKVWDCVHNFCRQPVCSVCVIIQKSLLGVPEPLCYMWAHDWGWGSIVLSCPKLLLFSWSHLQLKASCREPPFSCYTPLFVKVEGKMRQPLFVMAETPLFWEICEATSPTNHVPQKQGTGGGGGGGGLLLISGKGKVLIARLTQSYMWLNFDSFFRPN